MALYEPVCAGCKDRKAGSNEPFASHVDAERHIVIAFSALCEVTMWTGYRSRTIVLFDSELFYPVAQRAQCETQFFCGGRLVIARCFQRFNNGLALHVL